MAGLARRRRADAPHVGELTAFAETAGEQFDATVLLGMGGSSLAPEVIRRAFEVDSFHVLDTTHPAAIRRLGEALDPERTLFLVSSKSGSTLETRSHLEHFWELTGGRGAQFAAITDPGSELDGLAVERGFRAVFAGEPQIGGRYSALSMFGLVPAALMGVDVARFLDRAREIVEACRLNDGNPGYELGLAPRRRVAERPRQGLHRRDPERLRALGGAVARGVDREGRQGPRPRPGRAARGGRPPAGRGAARRPVRPRLGVLPLGVRDRGGRAHARDQPVRPTRRAGRQGQDERGPGERRGRARGAGLGRGAAGAGAAGGLRGDPRLRRPGARGRARRTRAARAGRPAASSRRASGRASCTRPASCTRAARTPASSSRSWTRSAPSCRSPGATSASAG